MNLTFQLQNWVCHVHEQNDPPGCCLKLDMSQIALKDRYLQKKEKQYCQTAITIDHLSYLFLLVVCFVCMEETYAMHDKLDSAVPSKGKNYESISCF